MMGDYYANEALKVQFLAWATSSSAAAAEAAPLNPLPQGPAEGLKGCVASPGPSGDLSSSSSDVGSDGSFDVDAVINGLCDMFKEKNGRDPTDDEVKIWIEQLTGANEGAQGEEGK